MSADTERLTIYQALIAAKVPIDSHESDLYCKATPEARAIVCGRADLYVTTFRHAVTGEAWFDIPFRFDPWWQAREARAKQ